MPVHTLSLAEQFNVRAEREGWPASCDDSLAFESPQHTELLALWRSAAGNWPMPRRTDITTALLGDRLQDLAILDYVEPPVGPRRYRFRLHGRNLARVAGDNSGKFVDEVIAPQFAMIWYLAFDAVLQARAPLRFVARFLSVNVHAMSESLVAPLCDRQGVPHGVLASVITLSGEE